MELASAIAIAGKAIGAGLCMGIGAVGPGIGEGNAVAKALEAMKEAARNNENLGETVIEACKAYATLGEMCGALKEVYGEYEPMKIY